MDDDQLQRLRDLAIALQVTRGGRPLVAEAVDEIDRLRVTIDTLTAEAVEANKAYNDAESQLLAEDAEIERLRAEVVRLDRLTDEQVLLIERQEAQLTELRAAYDDLRQRTVNMLTPADIGMVPVDLTVVLDGEDGTPHRRMLWREATP